MEDIKQFFKEKKIKGAIFDMDGTLLDSMPVWDGIGIQYLISLGIQPEEELTEKIKDMSFNQSVRYFQKKYGIEKSEKEMIDEINRLVEKFYFEEAELKNGMKEILLYLKEMGVKMCIATATDRYLVDNSMKNCGVREYFSEIFTCNEVGHGKDEPVIYEKALEFLGTKREETIVFEDAVYAMKTAKSAGFLVAGMYDAAEKDQRNVRKLADYYIKM